MNFFQLLAIFMVLLPIAVSAIETETTAITTATMTTVITAATTAAAVTTTAPFTNAQSSTIKTHFSISFEPPSKLPEFYLQIRDLLYTSNLKLLNARYTLEKILILTGRAFRSAMRDIFITPNNRLPSREQYAVRGRLPETPPPVYIYLQPPPLPQTNVCPADYHHTESFYRIQTYLNFKMLMFFTVIYQMIINLPLLARNLHSQWKKNNQVIISNSKCQTKTQTESTVEIAIDEIEMRFALATIADVSPLVTDVEHSDSSSSTSSVYSENTDIESPTADIAPLKKIQKRDNDQSESPVAEVSTEKKENNSTTQDLKSQIQENDIIEPSPAETDICKAETNSSDLPESTQNETEYAEDAIDRDSGVFKVSVNQEESLQESDAQITPAKPAKRHIKFSDESEFVYIHSKIPPSETSKEVHKEPLKVPAPAVAVPSAMKKRRTPHNSAHIPLLMPTKNDEARLEWKDMEPFDIACLQSNSDPKVIYAQQALDLLCDNIDKVGVEDFCNKFNPLKQADSEPETANQQNKKEEMPYILRARMEFDNVQEALMVCDQAFNVIEKGVKAIEKCEKRFMMPKNWNKLDLKKRMDKYFTDFTSGQDLEYMTLRQEVNRWTTVSYDATGKKNANVHQNIPNEQSLLIRIKGYMDQREAYRLSLLCKALRIIDDYNSLITTFMNYINDDKVGAYEAKVRAFLRQSDCK